MNRNNLFRKSLLSTAVVAVLHTYFMGASAAACPSAAGGEVVVEAGVSCDSITISNENLANYVEVKGTVESDVINTAELDYLQV